MQPGEYQQDAIAAVAKATGGGNINSTAEVSLMQITNNASQASTAAATKKEEKGTRLFIHVGPEKTGSSSIQCNLQVNPFLKESSYEFMGREEHSAICPKTSHRKKRGKFMDVIAFVDRYILRGWLKQDQFQDYVTTFKTDFRSKADAGINTILSAEQFCGLLSLDPPESEADDRLHQFANLLNDIPQSVTFQVVYRHYFDWALSKYSFSQIYRRERELSMHKKPMLSVLDERDFFVGGPGRSPSLVGSSGSCSPHGLWVFLREKLIPLLDRGSLEVFDFHGHEQGAADGGGDDLPTRYICHLPDAEAACERSRAHLRLKRARPTNHDILHSDRIARAAWEGGMFANASAVSNRRRQTREIIVDRVRNGLNLTFAELPLECLPDDVLSRSLDLSIRIGKTMLGEDGLDVEALESKFLRSKSGRKFCSVKVTALLTDPAWQDFFKNMEV